MLNLEKITIFHSVWDSELGAKKTETTVYDGHWYEHIATITENGGLMYQKEIKVRIPEDKIEISVGDRIAKGIHEKLPTNAGTVTVIADCRKGVNPHWLIIGK